MVGLVIATERCMFESTVDIKQLLKRQVVGLRPQGNLVSLTVLLCIKEDIFHRSNSTAVWGVHLVFPCPCTPTSRTLTSPLLPTLASRPCSASYLSHKATEWGYRSLI